ncbi:MAG: AEC family transporter [Myxococcota bacterium]|nr:AEC family transporter [Myxococcota bacterium]
MSGLLLGQFTLGYWVPESRVNWRKSASQVAIYGIILGLLMMFLHIKPLSYIDRTLSLIGQLTIPLLLFSLGSVKMHTFHPAIFDNQVRAHSPRQTGLS